MHHIKNDKRTLQSADLLYQGLLACLKEKPLAEVTVTDLQRASGVARSTFYRSFDDVSDVLAWQCDLGFHEALCGWRPRRHIPVPCPAPPLQVLPESAGSGQRSPPPHPASIRKVR